MDTTFRDGFQSVFGSRVFYKDFMPAVAAAKEAGINYFEFGGGARYQSLFFYLNESATEMMDTFRKTVGPDANLQTLSRGINVVALKQCPRDIIDLHAKVFKKHGTTTIRNFDALNDVNNLIYSGECILKHGLKHQITITMMDLPPHCDGAHTADFYISRIKEILKSGIHFDSLAFKDASGTSNPQKVYETMKAARQLLGEDMPIHFHTHDTAGQAIAQCLAAIEGGSTKDGNFCVDLAQSPISHGTCQPDIITMAHALKGKDYTLDIDIMKILKSEDVLNDCLKDYFMPPEARQVTPSVTLSPLPGGALTSNTMMMRDQGIMDKYPEVIKCMSEVVAKGGFGTSVTPVSQFYWQQSFANAIQGPWKKITDGYGNMVLGYFGKTPCEPDPEVVKLAKEQLGKDVYKGNPLDELEPGIPAATKILKDNNIEVNDENILCVAICGDKGLKFLKGEAVVNGVRKNEKKADAAAPAAAAPVNAGSSVAGARHYNVTVDGVTYAVTLEAGNGSSVAKAAAPAAKAVVAAAPVAAPAAAAPVAAAPAAAAGGKGVTSPMPGTVLKVCVAAGQAVKRGDDLVILEAMKMETPVKADCDGTVSSVAVAQGQNVTTGQLLVSIG